MTTGVLVAGLALLLLAGPANAQRRGSIADPIYTREAPAPTGFGGSVGATVGAAIGDAFLAADQIKRQRAEQELRIRLAEAEARAAEAPEWKGDPFACMAPAATDRDFRLGLIIGYAHTVEWLATQAGNTLPAVSYGALLGELNAVCAQYPAADVRLAMVEAFTRLLRP